MPRIYLQNLAKLPGLFTFPPRQAQHLRVLRLQPLEEIELFDGQGLAAMAKLIKNDKKEVAAEILAQHQCALSTTFPIHLGMSLIRPEAMDWVFQKAVELGVREITPIIAERSQGRLNQAQAQKKYAHWQEIMISACEQCGLNFLPQLHPMCLLPSFLQNQQTVQQHKFILNPHAESSLREISKSFNEAILLIGPEGGFTHMEITSAETQGFQGISIHEQILRAETAAISAVAIAQFCFS